jgi:type IV secretion system protein VirB9
MNRMSRHCRYCRYQRSGARIGTIGLVSALALGGVLGGVPAVAAQQSSPKPRVIRVPDLPTDATHGLDATAVATQAYQRTGQPRPVRVGDVLAVPYGTSQPTLVCAPLRLCVIRLQAGETLLEPPGPADSERWITGIMHTGPDGATPLVYVKPVDCDLTTNLVISTDRHLYNIMLDAPPCGPGGATKGPLNQPEAPFTASLTFYYPAEMAAETAANMTARRTAPLPIAATPPTTPPGVPPEQFNFAYHITKDKKFPWQPSHVFDDGVHTYIGVPREAAATAAPVLFVLNDDGTRAVLNYTLAHGYYITDRVIRRAVLVLADGGKERTLRLTNTAPAREGAR